MATVPAYVNNVSVVPGMDGVSSLEISNFNWRRQWIDIYVVTCHVCLEQVRAEEILDHLEKVHDVKFLRTLHNNKQRSSDRNMSGNSNRRVSNKSICLHKEKKAAISKQVNSSNYNMKVRSEVLYERSRISKQKMVANLKKRLM